MMEKYLGVKLIQARPMRRGDYNEYRGWQTPIDEDPTDEGFLVEYMDGGKSNHPAHKGYISWSPKDVFERAYRPVTGMTFGLAIEALKKDQQVARAGWNGKGMWLEYIEPKFYDIFSFTEANNYPLLPFIAMKTADNKFVPWVASQTDILAEDWKVVS